MTTIPDYITVLAMSQQAPEPREIRAVRATGLPHRERLAAGLRSAMRFARRVDTRAGATTSTMVLPELRDYPYRSGC